jgi:hypothetical protein
MDPPILIVSFSPGKYESVYAFKTESLPWTMRQVTYKNCARFRHDNDHDEGRETEAKSAPNKKHHRKPNITKNNLVNTEH